MLTIYGKLYSSKNSRRIFTRGGKPISLKSENATKEFKSFLVQLADAKNKAVWREMTTGKEYPYRVEFTIYKATNAAYDFDNATHNLRDAMKKAGYLPDDNMKFVIPVYALPSVDKANPRVEVRVL